MANPESPSSARQWNMRLGLFLFFVYSLLYLGFVLISALAPDEMERIVAAGLNLAVVYGFALIVIALVMSVIYGLMCRTEPSEPKSDHSDGKGEVQ